jgi:hypothetical protein
MRKNKKKANKFDVLVEKLVEEFSKIPNFEVTSKDAMANEMFNRIAFRTAEISSYSALVCSHFIPATNKAIFDAKADFLNSKYSFMLNTSTIDFTETLYDTIRLSYVGLFHKVENFVNDMIAIADMLHKEIDSAPAQSVYEWARKNYKYDFKDWKMFSVVYRINWICNCVKHKDGYPLKEPRPAEFMYTDLKQRLKLTQTDFKLDCELLLKIYEVYISIILTFAQLKFTVESFNPDDYSEFPDLYQSTLENRKKMEKVVEEYVTKLNAMRLV